MWPMTGMVPSLETVVQASTGWQTRARRGRHPGGRRRGRTRLKPPRSSWRTPGRTRDSGWHWMIRVLLAEDQLMFRTAVRRLLELENDIEVVAEVARGDEVVPAALASRPDITVVDIEMQHKTG